jgi:diaminohydroxyphosphoribosylaminopyrimidine deaminase/5-amino-6-(5-phosphoribosylamino)uracil reductase
MTSPDVHAIDAHHMMSCLKLAAKGRGTVSPNPMVGAVLVRGTAVIGKGWHRQFGGHHAEIDAMLDAQRHGESIAGATLYVSLEPCFHHGKTPPCVDSIIEGKISRVVAAVKDPNPLVNGKSIGKLRRAGIAVEVGVCRREAQLLNESFFAWFAHKRPFVALKAAQTSDGFIARSDGSSKWITNTLSRKKVHALRSSYDAILVGAGTVLADDPMLTVRSVKGSNPLRIVVDGRLRIPIDAAVVRTAQDIGTIVYTARTRDAAIREKITTLERLGVVVIELRAGRNKRIPVNDILADLGEQKIMSVLVEGGADVYEGFLKAQAADIIYQFTSPKKFGEGLRGIPGADEGTGRTLRSQTRFGRDILDEYVVTYV